MRSYVFILMPLVVSGCMSMNPPKVARSLYQPQDGTNGGYSEARIDDKVMVTRFAGNGNTHRDDASAFSQFRALELCKEQGFRITRILSSKDLSTSQTVQRTSNFNFGNANASVNGFGQPFPSAYYSGTANQVGVSNTWNQTFNYPTFDTFFSCKNQAYLAKLNLKEISAEDAKPFVKDLMGVVQIQDFIEGSPNRDILRIGDFILRINGERIRTLAEGMNAIDGAKDKDQIKFLIVRDGKLLTVNAKAVDGTTMLEESAKKFLATVCSNVLELKNRSICLSQDRGTASPGNSAKPN